MSGEDHTGFVYDFVTCTTAFLAMTSAVVANAESFLFAAAVTLALAGMRHSIVKEHSGGHH